MGNLAKGSPLIKKLIFFVSYLTRAENHRDEEEIKRLNANRILEGKEPKYDLEKAKDNIEIVRPSELTVEGCYKDVFGESIKRFNATQNEVTESKV